ncbi:MAG: organic solvent tolerance protein OstA, partial [Pirellulales bacterium]
WLFNVHGIAHKVVFDADLSFADASSDLTELPLYEQLDDDNLEQFRRRFGFNTFGVPPVSIPLRFDERFYALRTGLGGVVTSPSTEIADDLAALRLGARQRWQTKRGPENNRRILDFIVLDTEAVFFPNEDRDNFGESLGLLNYDFRWHLGDRTTIVSDGIFDLFDQGQELVSLGAFLNRPGRGSLYVGFHSLQGPIDAQVLSASYSYRMSPKWVSAIGTSVDIGGGGNIGQAISLTRIGESFLTSFGFNVDASKGNVGLVFSVEPRFLPRSRLGNVGGVAIPPAGLMGLE